jgi:hypothetical protein
MFFPRLRKVGDFVFCARPRRFGKSLTVTALDAFFSGRTELFRGLAVERDMLSPEFVARPAICLDMSEAAESRSIDIFERNILDILGDIAKRHSVTLRGADPARALLFLIRDINEVSGKKVVVLIDEYDAPVISIVQRQGSADQRRFLDVTRESMRGFYSQIKAAVKHIEFVFITGVTKFSVTGVFSLLNNLVDISLRPQFGEFMGFTHNELVGYFSPYILETAEERKTSEIKLLKEISHYYEGFSFDGKTRLYNPFSVLAFFGENQFDNFWMESGSNTVVRKFLKDKALVAQKFEGMAVPRDFAENPGEIDATPPEGFLYQSGYLTLRKIDETRFFLEYPNLEVRKSISTLFLENLALESSWSGIGVAGGELGQCLEAVDVPGMVNVFIRIFADICYDDHSKADSEPASGVMASILRKLGLLLPWGKERKLTESLAEMFRRKMGEGFYRSVLHAGLCMAGARVTPERHVGLGRIDLLVEYGDIIYVIGLKMAEDVQGGSDGALARMNQIREKRYGRAFKDPVSVSLAIGWKERNIVACRFEIEGHESVVEIADPENPSVGDGDPRQ